jgi:hypothetical protein
MTTKILLLGLILSGCGPIGLTPIPWDTGQGGGPGPGPDSEPESDSDETDPGQESAPELSSFEMSERSSNGTIQVSYDAYDSDGDMAGGEASLTVGGRSFTLSIPDDLDSFSPNGTSRFQVDSSHLEAGQTVNGVFFLKDAAGHRSETLNDSLVLEGGAYVITENGDTDQSRQNLGTISLPATLEGDIYRASNDGYAYTGDLDWIEFRVGSTGSARFALTWDAVGTDYDLHLLLNGNTQAQSVQNGDVQPESFNSTLQANTTYVLVVAGWEGNPGDYTVVIQ